MIEKLETQDVARLIRLLAEAGDPTVGTSVPDRKRFLIAGLAEIIEADIWIWTTGIANSPETPGDAMATSMIDGGWTDDDERLRFLRLITDPARMQLLQGGIIRSLEEQRIVTIGTTEIVDSGRVAQALEVWSQTGLGDSLIGLYPLGPGSFSGLGFHRRKPCSAFTQRERAIVQLVVEQVDWLHRHSCHLPAEGKVLRLSARQRQVLLLLLGGDGQRQIATKMQLSEHTINDYVKQIYRRFEVNGRGELFAHFVSGGRGSSAP